MSFPPSRYQHEASDAEKDAYALAHAAFTAIRGLEAHSTYGVDVNESIAQAHQTRTARELSEIDDAMDYLKARKRKREQREQQQMRIEDPLPGPALVGKADTQGEQQIAYDTDAWDSMVFTANHLDLRILGEEDQFRKLGEVQGGRQRGLYLRNLVDRNERFAIVDPLDGSNQAAGMGQRSGWASCALVRYPKGRLFSGCILLGDGRAFVTDGHSIWLSESSHPDRPATAYLLDPLSPDRLPFERHHYIIPATKRTGIAHAEQLLGKESRITWLGPLGGNPGIMTGLICAGAVAAMQPKSWAWDQMATYMMAVAGFPVLGASSGDEVLSAEEITSILLEDLAAGRMTESMYIGRTIAHAERLRNADLAIRL